MTSSSGRRRILLGGAVAVLVLAVLAGVSLLGGSPDRPGAGRSDEGPVAPLVLARLDVPRRDATDPLARGRPDAPVVVAIWSDFRCPFCRLYTQRIAPALDARYVDRGLVRVEWHDFAYLGPESVLAARGARAAGRQGAFWPFHDALFDDRSTENAVTDASLGATAARLGLDPERFRADYDDPTIARAVADDQRLGASLGVGGVPSFVIDDRLVFGAQPAATFEQVIDAALAARAGR